MTQLQRYDYPRDHDFVRWGTRHLNIEKPALAVNCTPGEWIEHRWMEHPGKGMLVANGDDYITVLWSDEPRVTSDVEYVQQKLAAALKIPSEYLHPGGKINMTYNPLAMEEDISIPVACQPNERKPR